MCLDEDFGKGQQKLSTIECQSVEKLGPCRLKLSLSNPGPKRLTDATVDHRARSAGRLIFSGMDHGGPDGLTTPSPDTIDFCA